MLLLTTVTVLYTLKYSVHCVAINNHPCQSGHNNYYIVVWYIIITYVARCYSFTLAINVSVLKR